MPHPQSDADSRLPSKYSVQSRAGAVVKVTLQDGEKVPPTKMFHSGLRTSRLGTRHNGSTARFMQGLAACLGKSKQESRSHRNLNGKARPPFALLPPLCPVLQTQRCRLALLSTELCRACTTSTWEGWRGSSPLVLLTCCSSLGIGDQGKQVGPCPPLKNLMLVPHGAAIPCSLKPARTRRRVAECC